VTGQGSLAVPEAHADKEGRDNLKKLTPDLGGTPLEAALAAFDQAIDRAMQGFSTALPFTIDWREGVGRLVVPGPVQLDAKSGATLRVTPYQRGRPVLALLAPSGDISGAGQIALENGGFGHASIRLASFQKNANGFAVRGAASMENWEHKGGRLALFPTQFDASSEDGVGNAEIDGRLSLDAETGAVRVARLGVPLQIRANWGDGMRIALREPGCAQIAVDRIGLPGMVLDGKPLALCPIDGALLQQTASGQMGGGFYVQAPNLAGRMEGQERMPIVLAAARVEGRFSGEGAQSGLQISARAPSFSAKFSSDRTLRAAADVLSMRTRQGAGPSMVGAFSGGTLEDPTLPAHVERASGALSVVSSKSKTIFHIEKGQARLTARRMPNDADKRPLFNPLLIANVSGQLADEQIRAGGQVLLEAGARPLTPFTAEHDLAKGEGRADFRNPTLTFGRKLDLYEIAQRMEGVADGVVGPVGLDMTAKWDNRNVYTFGDVKLNDLSFNAAAMGPVEGLSGTVHFRDLAELATPPGQQVTIRKLNPGIPIENGVVRFEVQGPDEVAIESARWPFPEGELSIEPQKVQVSSEDFSMTVTLKSVDVQGLIDRLGLKDLKATGTVEGSFPLVFSKDEGGKILNGQLHAAPGGGTVSYTGQAGAGLQGAPQIAFDALKSFRYDQLTLGLNGDLDGEIVTDVQFSGENLAPVGGIPVGGALPVPGAKNLSVTGLPFRFGVSVRAPFRQIADNAKKAQDARALVNDALKQEGAQKQNEPKDNVDQPPPVK
jgi:hypothetical protein